MARLYPQGNRMKMPTTCCAHLSKQAVFRCAGALAATALFLSGCAGGGGTTPGHSPTAAVPDGHYRVQRGDNLYRIGLRFGQSVATLSAWNRLSDPSQIEVGQILRVRPTGSTATRATAQPNPRSSQINNTATDITPANRLQFQWPASGPILAQYNGTTQKGIDIGGSRGTPVKAAADGKVLYAGNEVRGYGNLILIRHNSSTLTAYAHNDNLRVRKDQTVKAGDTIATMGDTGTNRVKLHFEIRIGGKAVNPLPYLPK